MAKKINYIICILSFILLLMYMILKEGINNIMINFQNLNYIYVLFAILSMFIYIVLESGILNICIKNIGKKIKYKSCFKISVIGQMFNQITPFASGGQPIQAYYMTKENIKIGDATAILLIKFIIYQITLTVFTGIIVFLKINYFKSKINNFVILILIGFLVNFFVLIFLILTGTCKNTLKKLSKNIILFLEKIKLCKNSDKKISNINLEIDKFNLTFKKIKTKKKMLIKSILLTILQLIFYFALPYFIMKGISPTTNIDIILVICASAFVHLVTAFIPTPGSTFGAEGTFYIIFSTFFSNEKIIFAIFLWRICTFYLPIILGIICMTFNSKKLSSV